jgi:hypothetical protein
MPLILPGNVGSATAATGYNVANSVRFNSGDSAVLKRTHGTPTNAKKFVWSAWIKRSKLGADQYFVQNFTDSSNISMAYFRSGDDIRIFDRHGTGDGTDTVWISDAKFRDVSAWMHFLLKVDTTQSTDSNRLQVYINGSLATGNTITYPAENADMNWTAASASSRHSIGATSDGYNYVGGYMCEIVLIDGTAPAHTDFGEFNSDSPTIWQPKDVSGLTFGDNGYYLDFEDSGDLGDDESGNGNDFAETNLAATDQSTDTCTNNFATLNSLNVPTSNAPSFSEGNLQSISNTSASGSFGGSSTIGVSTGKWYVETKCLVSGHTQSSVGVTYNDSETARTNNDATDTYEYSYRMNGNKQNNGDTSYGDTYTTNDIIGIALDLDNNKIYFSKNGTFQNSGDPTTGSTGTGAAFTVDSGQTYMFYHQDNTGASSNTSSVSFNFGSPAYAISSGNTDGNGYGNFEYAVPSGYYSLNTKNLAEFG